MTEPFPRDEVGSYPGKVERGLRNAYIWTEEMDWHLRRLHKAGFSLSAIGNFFHGMEQTTVRLRARKLGLPKRQQAPTPLNGFGHMNVPRPPKPSVRNPDFYMREKMVGRGFTDAAIRR